MSASASLLMLAVLIAAAGTLEACTGAWVAGLPARPVAAMADAALVLRQQPLRTEHPDAISWLVAPSLYVALAAAGMVLIPFDATAARESSAVGIVGWGALEALTVVVVFLHGWSANAPLPLLGAYRYVAIGLPAMLLSMFVLIAAALPARSLSIGAIVEAQRTTWNVLRQPLGLPLLVLLGWSLSLRGPLNYADSADLDGGTLADGSGARRAAWQLARLAMLAAFSAMAAAVFLGGYLGPWLPGWMWLLLKALAVLALSVTASHLLPRPTVSRGLSLLWLVLLPLAFVDLLAAGLESLR